MFVQGGLRTQISFHDFVLLRPRHDLGDVVHVQAKGQTKSHILEDSQEFGVDNGKPSAIYLLALQISDSSPLSPLTSHLTLFRAYAELGATSDHAHRGSSVPVF